MEQVRQSKIRQANEATRNGSFVFLHNLEYFI